MAIDENELKVLWNEKSDMARAYELLNDGDEISDWACDSNEYGEIQSNGGVERLFHFRDGFYRLISDFHGKIPYPNTLHKLDLDTLIDGGGLYFDMICEWLETTVGKTTVVGVVRVVVNYHSGIDMLRAIHRRGRAVDETIDEINKKLKRVGEQDIIVISHSASLDHVELIW